MVFCGRCGLQLAPGSTRCPRCGGLIEVNVIADDPHLNDPTVISPRRDELQTLPSQPDQYYPPGATPSPPSQVVLRPGEQPSHPGNVYSTYTPMPPVDPVSNPRYESPTYPSSSIPGQYGDWNTPIPEEPKRHRGGIFAIIAVILFLLIAGGVALAVFNPQLLQSLKGIQPTPIVTQQQTPGPGSTPTATATPTPAQEARSVIERYYNDINAKNYQDAYNLWSTAYQNSQTYSAFAAGYANTIQDTITIQSLTEQPDGIVQASVTITANEQTSSGPVVSTYQGTYVIGVENGFWKFLSGHFSKIS